MKCPRDRTVLKMAGGPAGYLRYCATCSGVWIQKRSFRNVMEGYRLYVDIPDTDLGEPVYGQRHPPITCPLDRKLMKQKMYHGIQVDICKKHEALWLDGGEYYKLLEIYRKKEQKAGDIKCQEDDKYANMVLARNFTPDADFLGGIIPGDSELAQAVFEFIGEVFDLV